MPFLVTKGTHLCFALTALAVFASAIVDISVNMIRFDPLATTTGGTVYSIPGSIFLILLVPSIFELRIEELINVSERDVFVGATSRRHMLRIGYGHSEYALKTFEAHTMRTGEFRGSAYGDIIG